MRAALAGDLEELKALLHGGADVNERNDEGRTPLMFAAINRETSLSEFAISGRLYLSRPLITDAHNLDGTFRVGNDGL